MASPQSLKSEKKKGKFWWFMWWKNFHTITFDLKCYLYLFKNFFLKVVKINQTSFLFTSVKSQLHTPIFYFWRRLVWRPKKMFSNSFMIHDECVLVVKKNYVTFSGLWKKMHIIKKFLYCLLSEGYKVRRFNFV